MKIVVGLGSNLGSRYAILKAAAAEVFRLHTELSPPCLSPVFRSAALPWKNDVPGADYLNAAVRLNAPSLPALLDDLQAIERSFGRSRESGKKWQSRTLDLDILWAEETSQTATLVVPHPHLEERRFALAPFLAVLDEPVVAAPYANRLEHLGGAPKQVQAPRIHKTPDRIEVTQALDTADALAAALSATGVSEGPPTEKRPFPRVGSICPSSSVWVHLKAYAWCHPSGPGRWRVGALGPRHAVLDRIQCF